MNTCPHKSPTVTPMQHPSYRESDIGWVWYHGYYLEKKQGQMRILWCGLPEPWRRKQYIRECGGCGRKISNPWVPVCESCWKEDNRDPYPSWEYVIELDRRRKGHRDGTL